MENILIERNNEVNDVHWIQTTFTQYPELALFLTLAIGYAIGKIRIGTFTIGAVPGVLITGVIVGQFNITINPTVKAVFFLLFLFSLGYNVGPQFFKGLKKEGLPQVLFAAIVCAVGLGCTVLVAKLLGYNAGQAAGLGAGALTQSSMIGVAQDAIAHLSGTATAKKQMSDFVPVGYAVTYIFGTIGAAFLISIIGPKIYGVDIVEECKKIEHDMHHNKVVVNDSVVDKTEKKSIETDIIFLSLGILLGGLIGIPALKVGAVGINLSTSGGALIMGLIFGLIHSKKPKVGLIPKETVWFLSNMGLSAFVAVVGINAGPGFITGLKHSGISFFFAGIVVTLIPLIVGIFLGKYIFKWNAAITLGACAGAQTSTPSLGAICEKAKSNVPVLGYTIPYAIGNILLTVWGTVIVLFFS